jgi:hypothetical protein
LGKQAFPKPYQRFRVTLRRMTLARAPAAATEPSDIELVDNVLGAVPGAVEAFYRRHSQLIRQ